MEEFGYSAQKAQKCGMSQEDVLAPYQPVDVGFNKPLKDCICAGWEEWMIQEGLASRKPSTCKQVTNWTVITYNDISNLMVRNAWKHADYSWFDN